MCVNVFSLRAVCSREMESKTASHTNEAMQQQQQQVQQQQEAQEQEGRFGTKASTAQKLNAQECPVWQKSDAASMHATWTETEKETEPGKKKAKKRKR